VVPLLAISFSLFNLFGGGQWFMDSLAPVITQNLAPGSGPAVVERISQLIETFGGRTLGGIGVLGFVLAVYGIFSAVESTFNLIWGVKTRGGALHRLPLYWGLVTIIPLLVVSSFALTTYLRALPLVHRAMAGGANFEDVLNRLAPGFMVMFSLFLLYRFLPSTHVRTYVAAIGAFVAGLLYEVVKSGFIFYSSELVQYNIIYGSLAIVPLLMIWINISWVVVLGGVEICFTIQHYQILRMKRKHVAFSRPQKDVLAYLILSELTRAFRGGRSAVTEGEWVKRYGVPPGVVSDVVDQLCNGGLIQRVGVSEDELLLKRDPQYVGIEEIDSIITGEALEEWNWPPNDSWEWLRNWQRARLQGSMNPADMTLAELVDRLDPVK
jgi:membrane protein